MQLVLYKQKIVQLELACCKDNDIVNDKLTCKTTSANGFFVTVLSDTAVDWRPLCLVLHIIVQPTPSMHKPPAFVECYSPLDCHSASP